MNLKQAYEASELVLKDFHDWKLPDIQLCFDRAKAGRYGKAYDRIDVQVIMDWCSQYDFERMEEISQVREKESGEMKGAMKGLDLLSKLSLPTQEKLVEPVVERDHISDLFNKWYRQFDKMHMNNGFTEAGIRFIFLYGKPLSGLDYVTLKFEKRKTLRRVEKLINKLNKPNHVS